MATLLTASSEPMKDAEGELLKVGCLVRDDMFGEHVLARARSWAPSLSTAARASMFSSSGSAERSQRQADEPRP